MGIYNSSDIFKENIYELFKGINIVRTYIYEVSVSTKNDFRVHQKALYRVLQILAEVGMNINTDK